MNRYFSFLAYVATSLGLLGIGLVIFPFKKISGWYQKIYRPQRPTTELNRTEPTVPSIHIKKDSGLDNAHPSLLFKEKTLNHHSFSIVYLMALPGHHYKGYDLWDALISQKLQHGAMKIFHYYEDNISSDKALFRVATALEPGYFDINHIEAIKVPGLCLFMHNDTPYPLKVLDHMLKTAKRLKHLLGGRLCDYQRQPLSETAIQQYQVKLSSFSKDNY